MYEGLYWVLNRALKHWVGAGGHEDWASLQLCLLPRYRSKVCTYWIRHLLADPPNGAYEDRQEEWWKEVLRGLADV